MLHRRWIQLRTGARAINNTWSSEAPVRLAGSVDGQFKAGLIPQPSGPAGMYHVGGGNPVAVSTTTKHPDEAARFANWFALYSDEWRLRGIPASLRVLRTEYRSLLAGLFENPDAIAQALTGTFEVEPSVGYAVEMPAAWNPILSQLARGELSPQAAAEQIAHQLNQIMGSK